MFPFPFYLTHLTYSAPKNHSLLVLSFEMSLVWPESASCVTTDRPVFGQSTLYLSYNINSIFLRSHRDVSLEPVAWELVQMAKKLNL